MDTKKDCMIADCGIIENLASGKLVVGAKQLKKAVQKGQATHVFLAANADPAITEPIESMCLERKVNCTWVRSMLDLGRACGIDVGAAAAAAVE